VTKPLINLADLKLNTWTQGEKYASADVSFGRLIGMEGMGISYNEVPSGKSGCPFHNHHVEHELFIILEGEGTYRFGDTTHPIKAGDVLGAPAGGPDVAHQIINTGSVTLRYYGVSTMAATEVCEYPDSGKFGVYTRTSGNPTDPTTIRHLTRAGTGVDYWDGEPGAEVEGEAK
jgi:uncharacterized cupin superfamily protein